MAAFLRGLITVPLALAMIAFCIMNTGSTEIVWSPFHDPVSVSMSGLALGFVALGYIWAALMMAVQGIRGAVRQQAQKRRIRDLERRLEKAGAHSEDEAAPPALPLRLFQPAGTR